jgi:hypothetical protein
MSLATYGIATPTRESAAKRQPSLMRLLNLIGESRTRDAQNEIMRHQNLLPKDLEAFGQRITPRNEDDLPFGRR